MTYDVIVIGVGGMGSAAVYHLAARGARVLGLEQFDIPHDRGSSHGVNRIIRLAYFEDPAYVPLLRRAYALWHELQHRFGEPLLYITGGIDAGLPGSVTIEGSLRSCALHHLPHEVLDAAALTRRYPGYRLAPEMVAVYQPDGGFVLSERAIVAHVLLAQAAGAEVHARERVLGWETDGLQVEVRTERAVYRAGRLVITAGPWVGRLVPVLAPVAVPERQVLLWAQPRRPALFRLGAFPVFNLEAPEGRFYGFPVFGVPGFKIGRYHHRHEQVDPDTVGRDVTAADEAVVREGLRRYFPDADGPTMALKTCLFTNSPDEHFILDTLPGAPRVCVAAGFSGHGYKFCSVVGEIMADLALEGGSAFDLRLFRATRFQG
ncbi:MAG: N-methyl-L-tryptophan oxidase [Armatimonadota bacterium]|nr:N-methyl-L-tryptophan oxidase [Armatimonadota bacterium]MDR7485691.1 N-methyl-L-tryptophan oxidase [Armatimonadota bacterium]MDR7533084.1 N-methyl-L-tryptophan oxidase [Armatimonadota bacterium]MDR7535884.1 N-methyl-L-tryptophan oxidase [Armatimonadota bacterium]